MIKIIIFDADGVLIRGKYFTYYLEKDFRIRRKTTKEFFDGVFMDCIVGKKDLRTELIPYLNEWGWKKSLDDFLDYWHKSEHNIDKHLIAYIQKLRKNGVTCCLATNQNEIRFSYMLNDMGFKDYFDKVYASGLLGYRKPYKEFYEKIIVDLVVTNKNEVLFWDDRLENVEAAVAFGIQAEMYTIFEDFKTKMQTYLSIR